MLDHKLSPPLRLLTYSPSLTLHGFLNIGAAAYADISGADCTGASDIQQVSNTIHDRVVILYKSITMTMTNDQIAEAVDAALKYAIELAEEEEGWKVEKEQGEATVKTKKNKDGRKVWLCTATVNVGPKLLFDKMKVIFSGAETVLCSLIREQKNALRISPITEIRTWIISLAGTQP